MERVRETREGWHKVGECGASAGCILISDPCYVLQDRPGAAPDYTYDKFMRDWDDQGQPTVATVYPNNNPNFAAGVVVSTGWGDGVYPVLGRFAEGRLMEVRISFDGKFEDAGRAFDETADDDRDDDEGE